MGVGVPRTRLCLKQTVHPHGLGAAYVTDQANQGLVTLVDFTSGQGDIDTKL